jgi:GT2 family glycosyltransferase
MNEHNRGVYAAILAFGDRPSSLVQVLDALEQSAIDRIAIVAASVSGDTLTELAKRQSQSPGKYLVRQFADNLGSAGGYAEACSLCLSQSDCRWIWLLDDDNLPDADALTTLFSTIDQAPAGSKPIALACFRPSLPELNIPDIRPWRVPPHKGGCAGFHLYKLLDNLHQRSRLPDTGDEVSIFWAVYGGMLVPREILEACGLPRKDFFLYSDDLEWTSRISSAGFEIHLLRKAIVHDLQPPWNASGNYASDLARRIVQLPALRVYYELRNRNWLALNRFAGPRWLYAINRISYTALMFILCLRYRRMDRFRLMNSALRDAELGRLGKTYIDD